MGGTENSAHSKIGASSYYRWSAIHGGCPGSVKMCEGMVSEDSEYAKEGTLAHQIGSDLLENYFFRKALPADHGSFELPTDMMPAVRTYVDFVKKLALTATADVKACEILIEHKFDLTSVAPGAFGTADAVIYDRVTKKLHVIDYKHGAGISVEVENNLQLMYYGLGALLSTGFPCNTVELIIVQPRCEHPDGPIRRFSFSSIELIDFAADLSSDAETASKPGALLNPGSHCRFCPAAATKCPAIKEKAQSLAKLEFKNELSYEPERLAEALKAIPALKAWIKQVTQFAYGEAMHGRLPPGWKVVAKRATRKWAANEEDIVNYMKEATQKEVEDFYEIPSLKSPAQMEKLVSKQLGVKLREMMESVSSGYNLVPEAHKGDAVQMDPKFEFTQVEGDE